jgi:branched-chain amino acid aminotransferase
MGELVYINGELVPRRDAKISAFDRGFLYGYGLFETMRSYDGRVFALDCHLARLMRSARQLALDAALDLTELEREVYRTLEANELSNARIRLTVTAGEGERDLLPPRSGRANVVIVAEKLVVPPPEAYEKGLRAVVATTRRNSQSALSGTKSIGYLDSLIARHEAAAAGADEAILLNERGLVAECSTSNIFLVSKRRLLTPSVKCGILPGVTREIVLELANELKIPAVEAEIRLNDLYKANEAFVTSSIIEIMPIAEVDGKSIGSGQPGEVTKRLTAAYRQLALQQTRG